MILVAFETSSGDHKLVTEHEAQYCIIESTVEF